MSKDQESVLKQREMEFRNRIWCTFEGNPYRNATEIPSIMESFPIEKSDFILEVGAGSGRFTRVFTSIGAEVIAVDISHNSLKNNKRKSRCQAIMADLCSLPFRDSIFDKAAAFNVFQYVPSETSRLQGLKEIRRTLRKDGVFAIEVYNYRIWDRFRPNGKEGFHKRVKPHLYYHRFGKNEFVRVLCSVFSRITTTKPTIVFHPLMDTTAIGEIPVIVRGFQIFERVFVKNRIGEWAYTISCCVTCICQK